MNFASESGLADYPSIILLSLSGTHRTIIDRAAVDTRGRRHSGIRVLSGKSVQPIRRDAQKSYVDLH